MTKVCVLMADGFEEIEAITVIDMLRRAKIEVAVLGVTGLDVRGIHQVRLHADALLRDAEHGRWDAIVLPGGGPGAQTLRHDPDTQAFLRSQADKDVQFAAICAGPVALAQAGLLRGRRATCYPGMESEMEGAILTDEAVVADGPVLTSRGPATAMAFALALVERLTSQATAREVATAMLFSAAP